MAEARYSPRKVDWSGRLVSVQPRIRLFRSFDERWHGYQGYVLRIDGECGGENREFLIAVGEGAHARHQFKAGMELSGASVPVEDPKLETAEYYKTTKIKVESCGEISTDPGPPFLGVPPDLETYRFRGHRRLDVRTYKAKCTTCIWGCHMPTILIVDNWKPWIRKYRFETACYGPKNCPLYKAGVTRKAPGRGGISWEEEDWIDQENTSHRGPDD